MTKKMDNDIQMDNYIQMTKKLKTQKNLQPRLSEDDGEIFADISDGKWWDCLLYSNINKIILFCTHIVWVRYL